MCVRQRLAHRARKVPGEILEAVDGHVLYDDDDDDVDVDVVVHLSPRRQSSLHPKKLNQRMCGDPFAISIHVA